MASGHSSVMPPPDAGQALEVRVPQRGFTYARSLPDDLAVTSHEDAQRVAAQLALVNDFVREVEAWFRPLKADADKLHKDLCAKEREVLEAAKKDKSVAALALGAHQERVLEAARAIEREQTEAARQREEAARLEEAAALEREAVATGNEDLRAEATAILAEPVYVPPVAAPPPPKIAGFAFPKRAKKTRCVDLQKLVQFIAAHLEYLDLVTFVESAGNKIVGLLEKKPIPGLEVYEEPRGARATGRR